jgi:hypothetical protein
VIIAIIAIAGIILLVSVILYGAHKGCFTRVRASASLIKLFNFSIELEKSPPGPAPGPEAPPKALPRPRRKALPKPDPDAPKAIEGGKGSKTPAA